MKTETKKQPEKKDIGYYNTIPKKETLKEVAEKFAHGVVGVIVKHDDMTSTEYLEELIECGADLDLIKKAIPKAKEMEKEQNLEIGLLKIELKHTKTLLASCEKALEDRDIKSEVINKNDNQTTITIEEKKVKKIEWIQSECDFCYGEGYDDGESCENCNGTGIIKELCSRVI